MKKNLLLTLISFLISGNILAQNDELFTIIPSENISKLKMNNSQKDIFEKTSKDIYLKKMDIVQIGDISKIQKKGTLTFTIPRFGKVTANAKKIESLGKDNFKWIGEILGEGMMYIYNKNGNISGHISLGNTSYQINALGNNVSILAENDRKKMKSKFCEGKGAVKIIATPPDLHQVKG